MRRLEFDELEVKLRRARSLRLVTAGPLQLRGDIKVGAWLHFDSVWEGDARSFLARDLRPGSAAPAARARPVRRRRRVHGHPPAPAAAYRAQRWHDSKSCYLPFGADVHAERTFDGTTIPSRITAGWGHATLSWAPFFRGEIVAVESIHSPARDHERPAA